MIVVGMFACSGVGGSLALAPGGLYGDVDHVSRLHQKRRHELSLLQKLEAQESKQGKKGGKKSKSKKRKIGEVSMNFSSYHVSIASLI